MNREKIAQTLKTLRGKATQKETALAIGISQSTYAMYETGERVPSDEKKRIIAAHFGRSVQEIFFDQ